MAVSTLGENKFWPYIKLLYSAKSDIKCIVLAVDNFYNSPKLINSGSIKIMYGSLKPRKEG